MSDHLNPETIVSPSEEQVSETKNNDMVSVSEGFVHGDQMNHAVIPNSSAAEGNQDMNAVSEVQMNCSVVSGDLSHRKETQGAKENLSAVTQDSTKFVAAVEMTGESEVSEGKQDLVVNMLSDSQNPVEMATESKPSEEKEDLVDNMPSESQVHVEMATESKTYEEKKDLADNMLSKSQISVETVSGSITSGEKQYLADHMPSQSGNTREASEEKPLSSCCNLQVKEVQEMAEKRPRSGSETAKQEMMGKSQKWPNKTFPKNILAVKNENQRICPNKENGSKRRYSRNEIEALRYVHVEEQNRIWSQIYDGLGPVVARMLDQLGDSNKSQNHQPQCRIQNQQGQQRRTQNRQNHQAENHQNHQTQNHLNHHAQNHQNHQTQSHQNHQDQNHQKHQTQNHQNLQAQNRRNFNHRQHNEWKENVPIQGEVCDENTEHITGEDILQLMNAKDLNSLHVSPEDHDDGEGYDNTLDEDDYDEDIGSDDEYNSIQRPAFLVEGDPDFESGPPQDGLEYLRRVRWETAQIPKVKVANLDRSKMKDVQTVYMPKIPDIAKCPEHLLPSKEWEDAFLADFSELRLVLSDLENTHLLVPNSVQPRLKTKEDDSCCFFSDPMVSVLLGMDVVSRASMLRSHIRLLEPMSTLSKNVCAWLFSLCAAVDIPLDADTGASLRCLLRKCAELRAGKSGFDDEGVMLNILVTICGKFFKQLEN